LLYSVGHSAAAQLLQLASGGEPMHVAAQESVEQILFASHAHVRRAINKSCTPAQRLLGSPPTSAEAHVVQLPPDELLLPLLLLLLLPPPLLLLPVGLPLDDGFPFEPPPGLTCGASTPDGPGDSDSSGPKGASTGATPPVQAATNPQKATAIPKALIKPRPPMLDYNISARSSRAQK